jgi:hypothetical protein
MSNYAIPYVMRCVHTLGATDTLHFDYYIAVFRLLLKFEHTPTCYLKRSGDCSSTTGASFDWCSSKWRGWATDILLLSEIVTKVRVMTMNSVSYIITNLPPIHTFLQVFHPALAGSNADSVRHVWRGVEIWLVRLACAL